MICFKKIKCTAELSMSWAQIWAGECGPCPRDQFHTCHCGAAVVPAVVSVLMGWCWASRLRIGWWRRGEMAQGLHAPSGPGFLSDCSPPPLCRAASQGQGLASTWQGLAWGTLGEQVVRAPHSCGPAFVSASVVPRPSPGLMYLPVTGYLMDHWANGFSVNWSFNKWTIY